MGQNDAYWGCYGILLGPTLIVYMNSLNCLQHCRIQKSTFMLKAFTLCMKHYLIVVHVPKFGDIKVPKPNLDNVIKQYLIQYRQQKMIQSNNPIATPNNARTRWPVLTWLWNHIIVQPLLDNRKAVEDQCINALTIQLYKREARTLYRPSFLLINIQKYVLNLPQ